jgi:hypothetical protein
MPNSYEDDDQAPDFEKVILSFKAIKFLMKNMPEQTMNVLDAIHF